MSKSNSGYFSGTKGDNSDNSKKTNNKSSSYKKERPKKERKYVDQLPNADKAIIDPKKLISYSLDYDNNKGKDKALLFEKVLGFTKSNANLLIKQIQENVSNYKAEIRESDQHGQRYAVLMPITGVNGKTVTVHTGWIIDSGKTIPRLVTAYIERLRYDISIMRHR